MKKNKPARKWSNGELAEKVGQQPSVVTKWLSGTQNFTMDTLTAIANVFGISWDDLVSEQKTANAQAAGHLG